MGSNVGLRACTRKYVDGCLARLAARCNVDHEASCGYIGEMNSVGLRELKNSLSAYVRRVRAGEVVAITDRGEVVAELGPPGRGDAMSGFDALVRAGAATAGRPLSKEERARFYADVPRRLLDSGTVQALLDDERGER
jgi:antitoxin (DNA-binding transcriptional repressor) of toxin-antitoxin stability system